MRQPALPAGFRDVLFDEARSRRHADGTLASVFVRYGFQEVIPSGVEYLQVYDLGHQSLKERTFKFLDREDNLLALRADFTPAIARMVAGRVGSLEFPVKVWYSGNVFRRATGSRGQFSELWQVGAELLGKNSVQRDVEILALALECLERLGLTGVQVHVNHAGIFQGLIRAMQLPPRAQASLKTEIDRKDARGLASHLQELGVGADLQEQLVALTRSLGGMDVLDALEARLTNEDSRKALRDLREIAEGLRDRPERLVFDLTEIDELEYYTGVMFSFVAPGVRRELGKGGRYDTLLEAFGEPMPAVGFSFAMDQVLASMP
jgi:ATP phosphoribosyltransferase regulatory subunit